MERQEAWRSYQTEDERRIMRHRRHAVRKIVEVDAKNYTVTIGGKVTIQIVHNDITKENVCAITNC